MAPDFDMAKDLLWKMAERSRMRRSIDSNQGNYNHFAEFKRLNDMYRVPPQGIKKKALRT